MFPDDFTQALEQDDLPAALAALQAGVPHRYTALYRIDGPGLRCMAFHDRCGQPRSDTFELVTIDTVLRQFLSRDAAFLTDNAAFDERLHDLPCTSGVMACHSVAVHGARGVLIGTLCHFDIQPRGLTHEQFERLQSAARRLAPWLQRFAAR